MDNDSQTRGIICEKNQDFIILSCNKTFVEYAGVDTDNKIVGYSDYDLCWQDRADLYKAHEEDALKGNNYSTLIPLRITDGSTLLFMHTKIQKLDENNTPIGVSCHSVEIMNVSMNQLFVQMQGNTPSEKQIYYKGKNFSEYNLTKREKEVLFFFIKGKTISAIAKILAVSPRTIVCHIEHIKNKMGCHSKNELIDKAYDINLSQLLPNLPAKVMLNALSE